jgi:hypothetical protein
MGLAQLPSALAAKYRFEERDHAVAILANDFPDEFADLMDLLQGFSLKRSEILTPGGGLSPISKSIDAFLQGRGWAPKRFDTKFVVDGVEIPSPTHKIDNFKNRIGVEVEWNNKTEFYDRDLNNFRLLRQLKVLSVGVITTRVSELQKVFDGLGRGGFGASTTHWDKLIPKVDGGGAGGCPLLLVGIDLGCYRADQ